MSAFAKSFPPLSPENQLVIAVYGMGYVGLTAAVCFAAMGHRVIGVDINATRIDNLQAGISPIFEADLPELLTIQLKTGRLTFTTHYPTAAAEADCHILAVGTPGLENGDPDTSGLYQALSTLLPHIKRSGIVLIKSTVTVGTGDALMAHLNSLSKANSSALSVVSNPEFLREGSAVGDFLQPARVILGGDAEGLAKARRLYQPLIDKEVPVLMMTRTSAELAKYAANAMLACKISFMNQISQLADKTGANVDDVREGMAFDPRIGPQFLQAGVGYGGSCFPKDVRALAHLVQHLDVDHGLFSAIDKINDVQKQWIFATLSTHFKGALAGRTIGFWGLSFKPGTDDTREASSLVAIAQLIKAGASIKAYDPAVKMDAITQFGHHFIACEHRDEVLSEGVDALVITTEWPELINMSLVSLQHMLGDAPLLDGRNCLRWDLVREVGFHAYYSVGRPALMTLAKA